MPCWRLDAWSWLEVFGIYLEGLLYTWRRLLFDVGLVILEAYIWCPSFTMLSLEEFATCWRPWSWCPSFGGSCLWSAILGDDSWLMHLEAWEVFALVVLEIDDALLMMDEAWWLETMLHDYVETWHLTWWCLELDLKILSWISRTLFICLGLELTMTRMDDVMSLRWWWSNRCICSGSDGFLYSSLQARSCTL